MGSRHFQIAMLSISNPIKGARAVNYYLRLSTEDYTGNSVEQPGQWFGSGAEQLGLSGEVERKPFRNLLFGFSPDGKMKLAQNAGNSDRQNGWDMTYSAVKDFSSLWSNAPEVIRKQLEGLQFGSVKAALDCYQDNLAWSRCGKGGGMVEPVQVTFALFQHSTSRALDPQLHTHCVLANMGIRADGSTGTLDSIAFFKAKMALGAIYRVELAWSLRQMGLDIVAEGIGFRIQGVPRKLSEEFSQRRKEVLMELKESGFSSSVAAKYSAFITRQKKTYVPREELFQRWRETGKLHGFGEEEVRKLIKPVNQETQSRRLKQAATEYRAALRQAVLLVPEEKRTPQRMLALASKLAIEIGVNAAVLRECLEERTLFRKQGFIWIGWNRLYDAAPHATSRGRFFRIEWKSVFPHAPVEKIAAFKLPRVFIELPSIKFGKPAVPLSKWVEITKKKDFALGQWRTQRKLLFPGISKLSVLHGLTFPAFRLTRNKSYLDLDQIASDRQQREKWQLEKEKRQQEKEKLLKELKDRQEHGHSH